MTKDKNKQKEVYVRYLEEVYVRYLETIIIDLLDGNYKWYDIQYNTGLSEERCKEISKTYHDICSKLNL